jgi:hypothetical protein
MAEQREKSIAVLLHSGRKTRAKVELFPAEQWKAEGGRPGLYRLRVNGKWLSNGHKYVFHSLEGVQEAVGQVLGPLLGAEAEEAPRPDLPQGTAVKVPNGKRIGDQPLYEITHTSTPPIQARDGRWYVAVTRWGEGRVFVAVDDLVRKE